MSDEATQQQLLLVSPTVYFLSFVPPSLLKKVLRICTVHINGRRQHNSSKKASAPKAVGRGPSIYDPTHDDKKLLNFALFWRPGSIGFHLDTWYMYVFLLYLCLTLL